MHVITEVWVPGRPKTKGSLDFRPNGRPVESVRGSKEWRMLVAQAVRDDRTRRGLVEPTPAGVPVGVRALFVLPVPVGVASQASAGVVSLTDHAPIEARSGDLDKLCRNVLDALTDAGAYVDDVQVCRLIAGKTYADGVTDGSATQGALIQAWAMPRWDVGLSRSIRRLSSQ